MFHWFEKLVRDVIWKAIQDFFNGLPAMGETAIRDKLRSLTAGQQLSTSPLVKVMAVDNAADTLTLLVRGSFSFEGITPFMRLEVVVSRSDIDLTFADAPIRVKSWSTVLGDLRIEKKNAFDGELGFGYANGAWMGQGSLKLLPIGAGAAIYGGISGRGMVLGLEAGVPQGSAIPLGPTGLGLRGVGGDFAYNFVARLEKAGVPVSSPTAKDYVAWAREGNAIDRWKTGPIDKTTVGIGVHAIICTMADMGFVFELDPIGFSFLTPGGAIILGGKGKLLRRKGFGVEGYFVVDVASASLALGAGVNVEIKAPADEADTLATTLLKGFGQLDAFFSFRDPSAWFFDLGTEAKPCSLEVLTDVPVISILFSEKAEAYFRINNHRLAFGAKVGLGGEFSIAKIIKLVARLTVAISAYVGWDPLLIRAKLTVFGELGIKVWKFTFLLTGEASPMVYLPNPTLFSFELKFKLGLPWPIPHVEGSKTFGDTIAIPPKLVSPLLTGEAVAEGATTTQAQSIGGIHLVSERQWDLVTEKPWPDVVLVVPFKNRVIDSASAVLGPLISPSTETGYQVKHELTKLELLDLEHSVPVPNVKGIWANSPGGDTALLHVLGIDPMSWLTPHTDLSSWLNETPARVMQVFFGHGADESFVEDRAFGDLHLKPMAAAVLNSDFVPALPTRVLRGNQILLRVIDAAGAAIPVDQIVLFVLAAAEVTHSGETIIGNPAGTSGMAAVGTVYDSINLYAAVFELATPTTHFTFHSASGRDLLVYAVRYREARRAASGASSKITLVPGRYRLTVEGKSTGIHPEFSAHSDLYPSAPEIDWRAVQEFEVVYPETIRSHVFHATFGDNRLFAKPQHPWTTWTLDLWNPTLFGIGFPLYRHYHVAIRFVVSYIGAAFGNLPLKLRLTYEANGLSVGGAVAPTAAVDGASSMLPQSQNWITTHGGTVPPDAELILPALLPNPGVATLDVLLAHPAAGDVRVDQWSGVISRFESFRDHLAWPGNCLTVRYDAAGRHVDPPCATWHKTSKFWPWAETMAELRGMTPLPPLLRKPFEPVTSDELLPAKEVFTTYPAELTAPPLSWRLPVGLMAQIGALDAKAGVRYARFAAATGARFRSSGDPPAGIQDLVAATTVEAVIDGVGRPMALWLRTPEPVDWRRLSVRFQVSHVEPESGCPTGYAHRLPLSLVVAALPSPDGSAAFLTGALAGIPTLLPRGEYEVTLSFDPVVAGLPELKPSILVGPGPEVATLRFLQPYGQPWPLPASKSGIRHDLIELVLKYAPFDPKVWEDAVQRDLPAEAIEGRLLASIAERQAGNIPQPRSVTSRQFASTAGESLFASFATLPDAAPTTPNIAAEEEPA